MLTQTDMTDIKEEERIQTEKEEKKSRIMHAFFIGFLIGIVLFSVAVNSIGFFTLIPLYLIYRLITGDKKRKALKEHSKEDIGR
jgi:uncharacterized protein YqhQ